MRANINFVIMLLRFVLLFPVLVVVVDPAKILGVFPVPSISHQVVFRELMAELAKHGHHVTILTPNPVHYTDPEYSNLTEIDVQKGSYEIFSKRMDFIQLTKDDSQPIDSLPMFYECMMEVFQYQMQVPEMKKLLDDPEVQFDLCFFESLFTVPYPLKDRFNCSMILISSFTGLIHTFEAMGVPTHPVIYMDLFSEYTEKLNFKERVHMVYNYIYMRYAYYWKYLPRFDELAKKMFGDSVRPIDEIEKSTDMFFVNYHPILRGIRPTVPSVLFMGSIHVKKVKPLPSNIQKLLDDAKNGVIYFSLGSNVKSADLSEERRNSFLEAFRDMPYTVLWKWENDALPKKPKNVHISKWMPQQDILAHPNVKVFITQGGQQSMEEAIDRQVPLVGIPFLGDQALNVKAFIKFGIGLELNPEKITKESIQNTIIEVIQNPSYRQNMTKLHDLIYDQPQSSMERAVWWTEYVLRHRGASHLRSPAIDIPFYQYFLLDIIGFIIMLCLLLFLFLLAIIKYIQRDNINTNHIKKLQ